MKLSKKKAFTLVELLVVVLVLGVLAGVGVPKFKRMLETRKTGEAEAMLSAVRMEQEKRCIAGKEYRTNLNKLDVMSNASGSKNYTYKLTSTGIVAEAKGKSKEADKYSLQLTSYKEGNICCSGEGCKKLNKNYPGCVALVRDECSADVQCTGAAPASGKEETSGRCKLTYSQNVECDKDYGNWKESGFVLASKDCDCEGKEKDTKTEGRCKIDFTQKCDRSTGEMINYKETGRVCDCDDDEKKLSETKGDCTRTRTLKKCNDQTGEWEYNNWGAWTGSTSGTDETTEGTCKCSTPWKRTCNSSGVLGNKVYETKSCTCECPKPTPDTSKTENRCSYTRDVTCDHTTGNWVEGDWVKGTCTCVELDPQYLSRVVEIEHGKCEESRTADCDTSIGIWNYSGWLRGTCTCDEGYTYNSSTDKCEKECSESDREKLSQTVDITNGSCPETRMATCNKSTGTWNYTDWVRGTCTCNTGYHLSGISCVKDSGSGEYLACTGCVWIGDRYRCHVQDSQGHDKLLDFYNCATMADLNCTGRHKKMTGDPPEGPDPKNCFSSDVPTELEVKPGFGSGTGVTQYEYTR